MFLTLNLHKHIMMALSISLSLGLGLGRYPANELNYCLQEIEIVILSLDDLAGKGVFGSGRK